MLSGMYGELNREQQQLGAYEAAYDQGSARQECRDRDIGAIADAG